MADPKQGATAEDVKNQSEFYELLVKSNAEAAKLNELLVDRADQLSLTAEKLKSQTELQNKIATNYLNQITSLDEIVDRQKKLRDWAFETQLSREEAETYEKQMASLEEQKLKAVNSISERKKLILELEGKAKNQGKQGVEKLKEEEEQFLNLLKIKVDGQNTLGDILKDENNQYTEKQKRDALEKAKGINKDFLELQAKTKIVTEKVAKNLGLSAKFSDTTLGSAMDLQKRFSQMREALGDGGIKSMMKSIGLESFNFKNLIGSIVEETFKIAVNIEKASKELGKATGFGNAFNKTLRDTANNLTLMGGDENTAKDAISGLINNFTAFHPAAKETNEYLATTAGRLNMIGVQAGTSVAIMDYFNKVVGQTAKESADTAAQISMMGKQMGVTANKMATDFKDASGRLTIYGDDNIQVFKELAAQAKATGIAVNSLIEISKKYDSFDKAAESVGQLNAVLGTNLNTLEMINATDSERIEIIRTQVKASVGNFDGLDKYTKMHIANAMGLKDVAEAQRMLNMSQAEYLKNTASQQEAANVQAELATMTAELVPVMQKLGIMAMKLFRIFSPLINGFLAIGQGIDFLYVKFVEFMGEAGQLGEILGGIGEILKIVSIVALALAAGLSWPVTAVIALVSALGSLWDIFHKDGSPMLYEMFDFIAGAVGRMASAFMSPITMVQGLASTFSGLWDSFHTNDASKSFDIAAVAKIDMGKVASGIDKVKSALVDLSTLKIDGFLAMTTDGTNTSLLMGQGAGSVAAMAFAQGKLTVDVNMPEIALPPINVVVKVNTEGLKQYFDAAIEERATRN